MKKCKVCGRISELLFIYVRYIEEGEFKDNCPDACANCLVLKLQEMNRAQQRKQQEKNGGMWEVLALDNKFLKAE